MSDVETRRKRRRERRGAAAPAGTDAGSVPEGRVAKPRRSAAGRVFYSLFVIFALAALTAVILTAFGYRQYVGPGPLSAAKVVEVRKGLRTPDIAADLESAGVISGSTLFTAAAYLTGSRGRLKAGEYEFTPAMSMRDVLGLIVQGKSIVYKLTIPEGWTSEQALQRVRENTILTGDLTLSPSEGALFPDTYLFKRGATRDSVVQNMMDAQQKLVAELWEKRASDLAVKSVNEAVTLASIVEKETAVPDERPRVAAVFANRLKQRMRLQSDPTIIYGLAGGKGKLDRPLTKQDIALKTPYNTYRIDGLPPGPISNPGRAALEAVLHPPVTPDLYFVADGSGGHAFASTLDDHKKNVAKWREIERNRNASEADAVDELAAEKAGRPDEPQGADAEQPGTAAASAIPEPQIPAGTAVTEPPAAAEGAVQPKVVTPALPPVVEEPADAGAGKPAVPAAPEAADTAAAKPAEPLPSPPPPQPQPEPEAQTAAEPPTVVPDPATVAAVTVPRPRQKPRRGPQPGEILSIADRLVPIPMPKPAKP